MVAKILTSYSDFKDIKSIAGQRRVLLTGIEAAGKTSTLKSLQQMRTVADTYPTPGVAAEKLLFLGHNLSVFDLGGQRTFREMYLANPEDYFSDTMLVIFVIDVQTYSKFQDGLDYFREILDTLDVLGERPLLSIHFHKFDSPEDTTFHGNLTHIKQRMDEFLKEKGWTNVFFFNTSVFDLRTLVNAFSTVFRAISPMTQVLNDTLRYYSELHGLQGAFLITKRGIILSEYTSRMRSEDRDQMFEEIYKEIIDSPDKILSPSERQFGERRHLERFVTRSYPTGTYITITGLGIGAEGDLFLAMLNQDLEKMPSAFGEDFSFLVPKPTSPLRKMAPQDGVVRFGNYLRLPLPEELPKAFII
ncbi:MAG: ADP-ribosylation factor-like protein [Candidatus Hodarchaeota archaeon]